MNETVQKLRELDKNCPLSSLKWTLDKSKMDTLSEEVTTKKPQYNQVVSEGSVPISKNIVKQLVEQTSAVKKEKIKLKNKCTLLVRKPLDKDIRNSKDIRKALNKEYPGIIIVNCIITAGGSIKIEFDNEDDMKKVSENWKESLFGGNNGITSPLDLQTSGIVKHVYSDCSEEEIQENIKQNYNATKVEAFKRNGEMTGTVKITFSSQKELNDVINDRIKIFSQRYLMEEYKPSPRVIKCHRCQGFGHIARLCRSNLPTCGKCGEHSHETKSCTSSVKKCSHCKENHTTGDKTCRVMKEKLDQIKDRFNYGL